MTDPNVKPQPAPDEAPAEAPVAVPEDSEPPQGDPVTHGGDGSRQGHDEPAADVPPAEPEPAPEPDPVAVAEARAAEYLGLAQRKQAEFENFRRRMQQQVAQSEDRGIARLAKELLPALDHLELALQAAEKHAGAEEWVKGIRLVQEEVHNALNRVGIQPFAPYGEPFDPNEHDAMAQAPAGDKEPGTVAEVYQAGYRINGAVLRPARVVVAQ